MESPEPGPEQNNFQVGQKVKVNVPIDVLRNYQEGHGGFTPKMWESMPLHGEIMEINETGDLRVKYPNNISWTLNPRTMKVVTPEDDENNSGSQTEDLLAYANFCFQCRGMSSILNQLPLNETEECFVCSEVEELCELEPCGHKITCMDCTSRLKKCCSCQQVITKRLSPLDGNAIEYIPKEQRPSLERVRYLEIQKKRLEEITLCGICMENNVNRVFKCGHACCNSCLLSLRQCHICRYAISEVINFYNNS